LEAATSYMEDSLFDQLLQHLDIPIAAYMIYNQVFWSQMFVLLLSLFFYDENSNLCQSIDALKLHLTGIFIEFC